jgi:hypothetical protein
MKFSVQLSTAKFSKRKLIENLAVFLVLLILLFWRNIFPESDELMIDGSNLIEVISRTFNYLIFISLLLKINTNIEAINFAVSILLLTSIVLLILYIAVFQPAFGYFPYAALCFNFVGLAINIFNDNAKLKNL